MPAPSVGPSPAERMVALLSAARAGGVTFEEAWEVAWAQMIAERAWPHRKLAKAQWRAALKAAQPEYRAAYLGVETGYSRWHSALLMVADNSRFGGDEVVLAELVA